MSLQRLAAVCLLLLGAILPLPAKAQDIPFDPKVGVGGGALDYLWMTANPSNSEPDFWIELKRLIFDMVGTTAGVPKPKADPAPGSLEIVPVTVVGAAPDCVAAKGIAVHPNGRFVYLATDTGAFGNVCAYDYGADGKTLSTIPGSPFRAGIGTRSVSMHPSGKFLYTADLDSNTVSGFAIAQNGALTALPGSPYPAGSTPRVVAVDPQGRFVYVTNQTQAGTVTGFVINRDSGALTSLAGSPFPALPFAIALAIEPRGKYLYSSGGNQIQAYAIDQATGGLSAVGSGFGTAAGGMTVDPSGRYLYATSGSGGASLLSGYRIAGDGTVTAVGPGASTGSNPLGVAVSRTGRYVYTANLLDANVSGFRIDDATGTLAPLAGSPFPGRENTYNVVASGAFAEEETWPTGEPMVRPIHVSGGKPPYSYAMASGALPPGLTLVVDIGAITGKAATPGIYAFAIRVSDAAGDVATQAYTFTVTGASIPMLAPVVEYYNAALDHYFITWVADEIAKLDAGTVIKGWARTGKSFNTSIAAQPGSSPICRYYIPPAIGDSHFFGRGIAECNATGAAHPSFVLEDPSFMQMNLPNAGACSAGTVPVYRVFSNRPDANHRYTTERAVRDQMVAKGWLAEGDGPDLVVMCAPS